MLFVCNFYCYHRRLCTEQKKEIDTVSALLLSFFFFLVVGGGGGGEGKIDMMHTVQSE